MHKFRLSIDNVHKFTVHQNNYHKFLLSSSEATPVISLEFDDVEYSSSCYIGGREVPLSDFDIPLKDLPLSLRQFVGRYVYITARSKGDVINTYCVDIQEMLGVKMRSIVNMQYELGMDTFTSVRANGNDTSYGFDSVIDYCVAWKLYLLGLIADSSSNSQVDVGVKTRTTTGYNNSFVSSDSNLVTGKCKIANSNNSVTSIDDSRVLQFRCKMLNTYTGKLTDLPITLRDFCYQTI